MPLFDLAPDADLPPAPAAAWAGFVQVALERGVDRAWTYALPPKWAAVPVGARVVVRLRGGHLAHGWVVERLERTDVPAAKLKPIEGVDAGALVIPAELVQLALFLSRYYVCPLGMVLASMLPAAVKHGTGEEERRQVRRAPAAPTSENPTKKPTKLQQALLDAAGPEWEDPSALLTRAGAKSPAPLKALVKAGWLEERSETSIRARADLQAARSAEAETRPAPSPEQAAVLAVLAPALAQGFSANLLHGVTGSGKTEVYLRLIEALPADKSAILLVPEIALTPQTVARFHARFPPESVAVLHSGLTAAQRHAQWRRIHEGSARLVVGARSAVFAPCPRLGLLIVDEEHEPSYKQSEAPRYHARDAAVKRAQLAGCPVVLGSATPALETLANARGADGRPARPGWRLLSMPSRVPGAALPQVQCVHMGEERRLRKGIHLLSLTLEDALTHTLAAKRQALLLLNRRGFANWVACPDHGCGWQARCDHCDAGLVYHKGAHFPRGAVVRCHHCQAEQAPPPCCPSCGKKTSVFGLGTQRVEEELATKFPGVRVLRMDADTMATARDYREALDAFRDGGADILLGTQMIAKGLDFPNVTLVGVVSADTALAQPDFRAAERTFQLVSQVAGRAGRGQAAGRVVVQSFEPQAPVIQHALRHDYLGFADGELAVRREALLPPFARMARLVVRHADEAKARREAEELAAAARAAGGDVQVDGPQPCVLGRVADHFRFEVLLKSADTAGLSAVLAALRAQGAVSNAHLAVDVDPVSLM